ncbi:MAG TPA: hypothetical protein VMZ92_03945 [Planctomycetota bacterium]|nr:hypothetical protein [Planctomycetota bacterium]
MPIRMTCKCGKRLSAPDEAAGHLVKCPACAEIVSVPIHAAEALAALGGHEGISAPKPPPTRPFMLEVVFAFFCPLTFRGIVTLVLGAFIYTVLSFIGLGFLTFLTHVFAVGFLLAYFLNMVQTAAGGQRKLPELPDFLDAYQEILKPLFWMLGVNLFAGLPHLVYVLWTLHTGREPDPAVFPILGIWSALYFPMATMAVAIWRNVTAVSPHVVIPAFLRIPGQAALLSVMFYLILLGMWYALPNTAAFAQRTGLGTFMTIYLTVIVSFYFLCVLARVIGITHWIYRKEIGWFGKT